VTRLLIVGPPGAGKGTQSARLKTRYGIPDIATGDIFRANIKDQTPLGVKVKAIVDAGDYVPDSLTNALVTRYLPISTRALMP
jgi:adenylate kinase